jgi:glycine C-acetyltransferase/8-amino-7-oxononanoate synthase
LSLPKIGVGHQRAKPRERVPGPDSLADGCTSSHQGAGDEGASALADRFTHDILKLMDSGALEGSFADFVRTSGKSLELRTERYHEWRRKRIEQGVWTFSTELQCSPGPEASVIDEAGKERTGVNFASQDYLGLSAHREVRAAAIDAINQYGPHIAGAPILQGNSTLSLRLQDALAEMLGVAHVVLFPTGWAAGYGVITALIRSRDHVVLDQYAHNCCVEGASAATRNVHRVRHLSTDAIVRQLRRIRATDAENAILVVTEGIFSMNGDSPDLAALQAACREYEATLLVDVAHDLGAVGPGGTGIVGLQGLLGKVDLVIGSFSKVFASNGGFAATSSTAIGEYLRAGAPPRTFSNAISPPQCAAVLKAVQIVRSAEGDELRQKLGHVVQVLRESLATSGVVCLGTPGPLVPVLLGREAVGRITAALCFDRGVFANLIEYPAVSVGACRFRMQVMATHTCAQAQHAAEVIGWASRVAKQLLDAAPTANASAGA